MLCISANQQLSRCPKQHPQLRGNQSLRTSASDTQQIPTRWSAKLPEPGWVGAERAASVLREGGCGQHPLGPRCGPGEESRVDGDTGWGLHDPVVEGGTGCEGRAQDGAGTQG